MSKSVVLTRDEIVEVLLETAKRAMNSTSATHPVDIASAGSFAIEAGAETIAVLQKRATS